MNTIIWHDDIIDIKCDESGAIGYTYKSLACGIWALRKALSAAPSTPEAKAGVFERLITEITMAGGDSDTNAAVAGPLLGALFGYEGLPSHWVHGLADKGWLVDKADGLATLVGARDEPYDWEADQDTLIDGGKGEMTKEDVDKMFLKVHETMFTTMGLLGPDGKPDVWKTKSRGSKAGKDSKEKCIVM
jgi:hypothetical protein